MWDPGKALEHTKIMDEMYEDETVSSYMASDVIFEDKLVSQCTCLDISDNKGSHCRKGNVVVLPMTVQDYMLRHAKLSGKKVAVLNFASFTEPGGKFIQGAMAQEEALCHASNLYNVLRNFEDDYYAINRCMRDYGYYKSNMLYTPDILFVGEDNSVVCKADVITMAAPNARAIERSMRSLGKCKEVMAERLELIIKYAILRNVDVLVLGAYGCGVFRNDPEFVSKCCNGLLGKYSNCFDTVVFPIPDGRNYSIFHKVITVGRGC